MFKLIIQALGLVKDFANAREWFGKRWFLSKTLWINTIAILALWLQSQTSFVLSAEEQAAIIAVINIVVRLFTNQPLVLKEEDIIPVKEDRVDG